MGQLIYGFGPAIEIDDWGLRHLELVMLTKLRRDESFRFHWDEEPGVAGDLEKPGCHGTLWLSKGSQLYFSYDGALDRPLNGQWLTVLINAANGNQGLRLLPEPSANPAASSMASAVHSR
ncbi:MAG: hypothetical protein ABWY37_02340 [Microbacterium pygmaeum]